MKPKGVTTNQNHTLQTDTSSNQSYIKLPIANLSELSYMQTSLIETIFLLSQLEQGDYKHEQKQSALYWLSKIVLASYPSAELEGLSEWLEEQKEKAK